ncbi:MAG: PQQ-dependent sugar dehydrogenase [Woeseiaceae bacterium]
MIRLSLFRLLIAMLFVMTSACASDADENPFEAVAIAEFDEPWAMTFLPDGRLLVTEKKGRLLVVASDDGSSVVVDGIPDVDYGGQGGFGDVALHPDFVDNQQIYLSYAESADKSGDEKKRGAVVVRATLDLTSGKESLTSTDVIWRQDPKVTGRGHYGHRLLFSDDGYLFISSGDRQKFDPAQDMNANLGKILRLNDDGSVPDDNPFVGKGGISAQIWSLGHRNPLGIAFDGDGQLWNIEMGPRGGDELNRVLRGENYGYPLVSNGRHYSGKDIPDHDTRPEFEAPKVWWTPVISPGDLAIYSGNLFRDWHGDGLIAGLSSQALVRIDFDGVNAREAERFPMGERIRAVEQGPDGAIWLLEDGSDGRLMKLTPR